MTKIISVAILQHSADMKICMFVPCKCFLILMLFEEIVDIVIKFILNGGLVKNECKRISAAKTCSMARKD